MSSGNPPAPAAFLDALTPVVSALGSSIIEADDAHSGDHPVEWQGEVVAYVRQTELHGALERAAEAVEREVGKPLAEMNRAEKQRAVRRLDERGAFLLRGAVESVASRMGVSKVTLYSYLNVIDRSN